MSNYKIFDLEGMEMDKESLFVYFNHNRSYFSASRYGVGFLGRVETNGTECLLIVEEVLQTGWVQD